MTAKLRPSRSTDLTRIEALYRAAFPQEDLVPLVRRLLAEAPDVLSLLFEIEDEIVGHVAFTPCRVADHKEKVALLGPLAVHPAHQKTGLGRRLVEDGFSRLAEAGFAMVLVLGDPGYYGRFGFAEEKQIMTPCPIPDAWRAAWQSVALESAQMSLQGALEVPPMWREPTLWS